MLYLVNIVWNFGKILYDEVRKTGFLKQAPNVLPPFGYEKKRFKITFWQIVKIGPTMSLWLVSYQ